MHLIAFPLAHPLTCLGLVPPSPAGLGMASAVDEQSQQRHLVAFLLSGVEKQNSYMEMFCFVFFYLLCFFCFFNVCSIVCLIVFCWVLFT